MGAAEFTVPAVTLLERNHRYRDRDEMANAPRLYVPIYILIRVPLLTLFGAALAMVFALLPRLTAGSTQLQRSDITLVSLTVVFPLACQEIWHGRRSPDCAISCS